MGSRTFLDDSVSKDVAVRILPFKDGSCPRCWLSVHRDAYEAKSHGVGYIRCPFCDQLIKVGGAFD